MKNKKSKLNLLLTILLFFLTILMSTMKSKTNANNDGFILTPENKQLIYANQILQDKLDEQKKLHKQKIDSLIMVIGTISNYNNMIYSQTLNVDFDTTDFHKYGESDMIIDIINNDSIFKGIDDRTLYASRQLAYQLKKVEDVYQIFKHDKNILRSYPNISPVRVEDFIKVTSPYGWRQHPIYDRLLFHEGIDISAKIGSPVYSTAQGKVVKVMYSKYGYGNRVVVQHAYGFRTVYTHLHNIIVKRGQWVRKNQKIATIGNTGTSTGPHLHYEIRKNGETRDPLGYFYTYMTNDIIAKN